METGSPLRCWGVMLAVRSCAPPTYLGLTWLTGMLSRAAISSTVSFPSEMMPTPLAIALAVMGWSPVTMMTCGKAGRGVPSGQNLTLGNYWHRDGTIVPALNNRTGLHG